MNLKEFKDREKELTDSLKLEIESQTKILQSLENAKATIHQLKGALDENNRIIVQLEQEEIPVKDPKAEVGPD